MSSRYTFFVSPSAAISLDFLFVSLGLNVRLSLFFERVQLIYVGLAYDIALFYVSGLLLITKHGDDSFGRWYLHAHKLLPYESVEFVHESFAENREIWMIYINHIESESLCSGIVEISERYWKGYFSNWLDWLSSETL
jgi:hypothetical protein